MSYDPRDHALHGNEIVAALSLWFLVVLAGCLVPRSFEAAANRMAQQVPPSWNRAPLCTDGRAS
jgi:hypothetical protein